MRATSIVNSPLGRLRLSASDDALLAVDLPGAPAALPPDHEREVDVEQHPVLSEAALQLAEYFAGSRCEFDLPLAARGTPFQERVWRELLTIPFARTTSYAAVARAVGGPRAFRAVGAANGRNPIAIIIPCHRVVGSDGSLTGYGGGEPAKRWLLAHERRVDLARQPRLASLASGGAGSSRGS